MENSRGRCAHRGRHVLVRDAVVLEPNVFGVDASRALNKFRAEMLRYGGLRRYGRLAWSWRLPGVRLGPRSGDRRIAQRGGTP